MKCLEKDRARRYETANGLAADLQRHLNNEPIVARPASQLYRFGKMVRRNKAAAAGVSSVVLALVLGLGIAMAAFVRERAARRRELAQSVRADSVAAFINSLVSDALPSLMQQGNARGVRELIVRADLLASSSLTNAPAAEINLRFKLGRVLAETVNDYPAAVQQMEAIARLLPGVTDDQLSVPRDELRGYGLVARLWAAGGQAPAQEKAMKELESLHVEFMRRTPPATESAGLCRFHQGAWFFYNGNLDRAETACAESCEVLPRGRAPIVGGFSAPALYVRVLSERGKLARAEQVAGENLGEPSDPVPEARSRYLGMVAELSNTLCRQDRFAEASARLEEQRQSLAAAGGSEEELVRLDALRGAVLARSGNGQEALPILEAVATNRLSGAVDWRVAATVATAVGDRESFQRLCDIGLIRFASTIEGYAATHIATGLYQQPIDRTTMALARALVDRAANTPELSPDFIDIFRAVLAWREHRYPEALVLLDRFRETSITRPGASVESKLPAQMAGVTYLRAILCAELGRADDARHDFAEGRQQLKLALGDKPGHDLGSHWHLAYQAEIRQRAAQEVFKAKGIPIPEPPVK
jgi:hypothetical protein